MSGESPAKLDELVPWALRIAWRITARRGLNHYKDDLASVALGALSRALAAHDPSKGEIKPFAAVWIAGEVRGAADDEADRVAHERPLENADDREDLAPRARGEELAFDVIEALLDLYIGEELGSNGEAKFLRREAVLALRREIDRLPPDDRQLVELHYWEERTWEDIGAELGIGDRAARKRDARIRHHLREALIAWDRVRPLQRKP